MVINVKKRRCTKFICDDSLLNPKKNFTTHYDSMVIKTNLLCKKTIIGPKFELSDQNLNYQTILFNSNTNKQKNKNNKCKYMDPDLLIILKKTQILVDDEKMIHGMIIPREILLKREKYLELEEEINKIKKKFSSSRLTALQKTAKTNQKWPLLNLVRQLLKVSNIRMVPKRKSNGYDKTGKKLFKRYFILEKIKLIEKKDTICLNEEKKE